MRKCPQSVDEPKYTNSHAYRLMEQEQDHDDNEQATVQSSNSRSRNNSWFHNWTYAPGGFDVMGVLVRVATRPNPQIDLGPIDCSAAVIICDTFQEDNPIVYCSEAFTVLTGYSESETVGRNCRFLQSPCGLLADNSRNLPRPTKPFANLPGIELDQESELERMKHSLSRREEVQVMIGNYTRSGTPFANLISVVPVKWNLEDSEKRYFVGFQTRWDESKSSEESTSECRPGN